MALLLLVCALCLLLTACRHEHVWEAATCTMPKVCSKCGETEGGALGHAWRDATCTAPKTCGRCGETEGTVLGHNWSDATCLKPKTCKRCGETEGVALAHEWEDATYTTPKRCRVCGTTEGKPLELPPESKAIVGKWKIYAMKLDETILTPAEIYLAGLDKDLTATINADHTGYMQGMVHEQITWEYVDVTDDGSYYYIIRGGDASNVVTVKPEADDDEFGGCLIMLGTNDMLVYKRAD